MIERDFGRRDSSDSSDSEDDHLDDEVRGDMLSSLSTSASEQLDGVLGGLPHPQQHQRDLVGSCVEPPPPPLIASGPHSPMMPGDDPQSSYNNNRVSIRSMRRGVGGGELDNPQPSYGNPATTADVINVNANANGHRLAGPGVNRRPSTTSAALTTAAAAAAAMAAGSVPLPYGSGAATAAGTAQRGRDPAFAQQVADHPCGFAASSSSTAVAAAGGGPIGDSCAYGSSSSVVADHRPATAAAQGGFVAMMDDAGPMRQQQQPQQQSCDPSTGSDNRHPQGGGFFATTMGGSGLQGRDRRPSGAVDTYDPHADRDGDSSQEEWGRRGARGDGIVGRRRHSFDDSDDDDDGGGGPRGDGRKAPVGGLLPDNGDHRRSRSPRPGNGGGRSSHQRRDRAHDHHRDPHYDHRRQDRHSDLHQHQRQCHQHRHQHDPPYHHHDPRQQQQQHHPQPPPPQPAVAPSGSELIVDPDLLILDVRYYRELEDAIVQVKLFPENVRHLAIEKGLYSQENTSRMARPPSLFVSIVTGEGGDGSPPAILRTVLQKIFRNRKIDVVEYGDGESLQVDALSGIQDDEDSVPPPLVSIDHDQPRTPPGSYPQDRNAGRAYARQPPAVVPYDPVAAREFSERNGLQAGGDVGSSCGGSRSSNAYYNALSGRPTALGNAEGRGGGGPRSHRRRTVGPSSRRVVIGGGDSGHFDRNSQRAPDAEATVSACSDQGRSSDPNRSVRDGSARGPGERSAEFAGHPENGYQRQREELAAGHPEDVPEEEALRASMIARIRSRYDRGAPAAGNGRDPSPPAVVDPSASRPPQGQRQNGRGGCGDREINQAIAESQAAHIAHTRQQVANDIQFRRALDQASAESARDVVLSPLATGLEDDPEEIVLSASRQTFLVEQKKKREAEERYASELEEALKQSEKSTMLEQEEEERCKHSEEELVNDVIAKTKVAEEEALRIEEELLLLALEKSLSDNADVDDDDLFEEMVRISLLEKAKRDQNSENDTDANDKEIVKVLKLSLEEKEYLPPEEEENLKQAMERSKEETRRTRNEMIPDNWQEPDG